MDTKEQKAKEYAENKYCSEDNETPQYKIAQIHAGIDGYLSGYDEALKSQWISTKERMPKPNTDVVFLTDIGMIMNGQYSNDVWMQMDGVWGSAYCSIEKCWEVVAWMPIPSFDKILEDNKDVLKRLKDK